MLAVAGRPAGPLGGLCHVAAAKTKQKEGGERRRKKEGLSASDGKQQRENGEVGRVVGRVNSGEILLVSVKDGPWSALVSWRRRGFSRTSPVSTGGGGK